jgi:uncharacterized phage protein gp47/JayE
VAYVDPELIGDEVAVAEGNIAALADLIAGFLASEGHVETSLAEAFAISEATVVALILSNERNQYAGFGERVVGIFRHSAVVATSQVTIIAADALGHVIPAGFEATFATADGSSVTVVTTQEAVIVAGSSSVLHVPVAALEPGPVGNAASGLAIDRDDLDFVVSVTLEAPTDGGEDEEPLEEYIERVARRNRRGRVPASPDDYADFATDIDGVDRAIAVNRMDPANPLNDSLGHVTVYPVSAAGDPVGTTVSTAVEEYLNGIPRVMAALVHVADPTELLIDIAVTIRAAPGVNDAEARSAVIAALRSYLNKATWGLDRSALGGWRAPVSQVTIFGIAGAIDDLAELAEVTDVSLNGQKLPIDVPRTALVSAGTVTVVVAA